MKKKPEQQHDTPEEIEYVRRLEERPDKAHLDREAIANQRRLQRNIDRLLRLDVDGFLRVLREEYKVTDERQLAAAKAFWMKHHGH